MLGNVGNVQNDMILPFESMSRGDKFEQVPQQRQQQPMSSSLGRSSTKLFFLSLSPYAYPSHSWYMYIHIHGNHDNDDPEGAGAVVSVFWGRRG